MQEKRTRTETPVQFTDGHDFPWGPINVHGDPIRPFLASDGSTMVHCLDGNISGKIRSS